MDFDSLHAKALGGISTIMPTLIDGNPNAPAPDA